MDTKTSGMPPGSAQLSTVLAGGCRNQVLGPRRDPSPKEGPCRSDPAGLPTLRSGTLLAWLGLSSPNAPSAQCSHSPIRGGPDGVTPAGTLTPRGWQTALLPPRPATRLQMPGPTAPALMSPAACPHPQPWAGSSALLTRVIGASALAEA